MMELLYEAFNPANIIVSILLCTILLYWLFVMLGAVDVDFLDIDIDVDADVDVDVDADTDVEAGGGGFFMSLLQFFNLGAMPFMIFMSFLLLSMWVFSMVVNHYLPNTSLGFGLVLLLPNFLASLFVTKAITQPLVPFFKSMNTPHKDANLIGKIGTMTIPATNNGLGQTEINVDNKFLSLNVKAKAGEDLNKGTKVVFIEQPDGKEYYIVTALKEEEL